MNLKISVWCNQIANRVQITPLVRVDKLTNHTAFFLIDGQWWAKKAGTLMPKELQNEITPEQWMWEVRDLCVDEVERLVGYSAQEIVNGECVYFFPTKDAAMSFAKSIASECAIIK